MKKETAKIGFIALTILFLVSIGIMSFTIFNSSGNFITGAATEDTDTDDTQDAVTHGTGAVKCGASLILPRGQEPTFTAEKIDEILTKSNSPAAGAGEAFVEYSKQYGIDNVYAMGFFMAESSFGTAGAATKTNSIGNIVADGFSEEKMKERGCIDKYFSEGANHDFCVYENWESGIKEWYKHIAGNVYFGEGRTTLEEIVPKYAPDSENDVDLYIKKVRNYVSLYKEIPASCPEMDTGVIARYSVNPSFRASAKYSFEDYEIIAEKAKEMRDECSEMDKSLLETCIKDKIKEFNTNSELEWSSSITGELRADGERVLYDFIDNFEKCAESKLPEDSDSCVCVFSLNYNSKIDVNRENYVIELSELGNEEVGASVTEVETNVKVRLTRPNLIARSSLTIPTEKIYFIDQPAQGAFFGFKTQPKALLEFQYGNDGKIGGIGKLDRPNDVCLGYTDCSDGKNCDCKNQINLNDQKKHSLILYKKDDKIAFVDDDLFYAGSMSLYPSCIIESKSEYYTFSVKQKEYILPAFDSGRVDARRSMLSPEIKFALYFGEVEKEEILADINEDAIGDTLFG